MDKKWYKRPLLWIFVFVLFMWLMYWGILVVCFNLSGENLQNWTTAGTFGDMFGCLSCLFSGLAFAGLVVTIRQQKRTIELQKEELAETRQEIQNQTKQFEQQTKIFKQENQRYDFQNKKEDIYRRLGMLRDLQEKAFYNEIEVHWRGGVEYEVCVKQTYRGDNAFLIALLDVLHLIEEIKTDKIQEIDRHRIAEKIKNLKLFCDSCQPWMYVFGDILHDIKIYFSDFEEEVEHMYRIAIGMHGYYTHVLICVFRGFLVDEEVVVDVMSHSCILQKAVSLCPSEIDRITICKLILGITSLESELAKSR